MSEIDLFSNQLLEEAKRFLEKADDGTDPAAREAYLHAALMLAFCALEAQVNSLGEEFSETTGLSAHERGILLERDVKLENGQFCLREGLKIARIEDRIELLHTRFSGKQIDRRSDNWQQLGAAIDLRNKLTHAKDVPPIGEPSVRNAVQSVINTLDDLYRALYKRRFPSAGLGLQSQLNF